MDTDTTCKERINEHYKGRIGDIRTLWEAYKKDPEAEVGDLGTWNEYGLCLDYVAPRTFRDQRRGYLRYQISTGGPGDEFRFYMAEDLTLTRVEYWFLDWFDGAHKTLRQGADLDLLAEIYEDWRDVETVKYLIAQAEA